MRCILLLLSFFVVTDIFAQKNQLLDAAFWKTNPDIAAVKSAVANGADATAFNRSSFDPVVLAINNKAPNETIKYLLSIKGNEADKITHDGRIYMFWAAYTGNTEIMEALLQKGSRVKAVDSHGNTVLTFAALAGQQNTAVYDLLIKNGIDAKAEVNQDGANGLLLAMPLDKDFALTNYFISKGLSLNSVDKKGNTAFDYAAKSGNINLLKTLIEKAVKPTSNAILMAAQGTRSGSPATVALFEYLESLQLKPGAINSSGENVLHIISRKPEQQAVINYFLSKNVDVNQADNEGNTPFMNAAAGNRDTGILALLLPHVKNINQANKKGATALAMAINNNTAAVTGYLVSKNADVKIKDATGNNLAYYLVQSYNADRGFQDFDAKMKILVDGGLNVAAAQQNGNTLYHLAIAKNDLALLKHLADLKIDINAKNKEGLTVLHKAAMTAKDDTILKYLVSIGAKTDIRTDLEESVYDLAAENEYLSKNKITIDFLK